MTIIGFFRGLNLLGRRLYCFSLNCTPFQRNILVFQCLLNVTAGLLLEGGSVVEWKDCYGYFAPMVVDVD